MGWQEKRIDVDVNFTHTASTINLKIWTNVDQNAYDESFGIREFYMLIDYVNNNFK